MIPTTNIVIVTSHTAFAQWLKEKYGVEGTVISHASIGDIRGKNVFGSIPLRIAAHAENVYGIEMPLFHTVAQPGEDCDLTVEQMDAAGARLYRYVIACTPTDPPLPRTAGAPKLCRDNDW